MATESDIIKRIAKQVSRKVTAQSERVLDTTVTSGSNNVITSGAVFTHVDGVLDGAPAALNTLNEIAAAINDDASIGGVVTNSSACLGASGSANLGTFTGSTISDNVTVKAGLQALETAHENAEFRSHNIASAVEQALGSQTLETHIGTFTGSTISDNGTAKAGMQQLETALEAKVSSQWTTASSLGATDIYYNSGSVGIGTSTPSSALHVVGDILPAPSSLGVHIGSETSGSNTHRDAIINLVASSNSDGESTLNFWQSGDSAMSGQIRYYHTNNSMAFKTNASEVMRITSGGNVGIGTASPVKNLEIVAPGQTTLRVRTTDSATNHLTVPIIMLETSNHQANINLNSNGGGLRFSGDGADNNQMILNPSGNLGIGTDSPDNTLTLDGVFQLNPQSGTSKFAIYSDNDNFEINKRTSSGGYQGNQFVMKSNGSVGIGGEMNPSEKLHVNGACRATSFPTTSDDRVKHNETDIPYALETLLKLQPKRYWKSEKMYDASFVLDQQHSNLQKDDTVFEELGVIAQDLQKIEQLAFLVKPGNDNETPMAVDYQSLFVLSLQAIKDLSASHEDLSASHDELKRAHIACYCDQTELLKSQSELIKTLTTRLDALEVNI